MPENIVGNDYFDVPTTTGPMFRGTAQRHHMSDHEQASDMIMRATDKLCDRINIQGDQDIDIILTNVSLPDLPSRDAAQKLPTASAPTRVGS